MRTTITPQTVKLLNKINPDTIVGVEGSHSFIYTREHGLLVDPDTCRTHAAWGNEDPDIEDIQIDYSTDRLMTGRYCNFWDIPIAVFWCLRSNLHLLQKAARALTHHLPQDTVAVIIAPPSGAYLGPNEVVLLADLGGAAPISKSRGHQYWQTRQTSESIIREARLPTRQVLDDDLHDLVDNLTPDFLMDKNVQDRQDFLYTEDGELILLHDPHGHENWITNHRPAWVRGNSKWYEHCIAGRYGVVPIYNYKSKYHDKTLPILSIWAYKQENAPVLHLLIPAIHALIPHLPPDTIITCGAGPMGAFTPFPLSMLTQRGKPARGHSYWNLRQTSESYQY